MLNCKVSEVEDNLKNIFEEFYAWRDARPEAINYYAHGMENKNEYIQKIFDGTNGRIVLGPDAVSKMFIENPITERIVEYLFSDEIYGRDSFYRDLRRIFYLDYGLGERFKDLDVAKRDSLLAYFLKFREMLGQYLKNVAIDEKGIVFGKNSFDVFGKGQKTAKVLNSLLDIYVSTEAWPKFEDWDIPEEVLVKLFSYVIKKIKDIAIGGSIASIVSGYIFKDTKLVLSIRPEDIFLASNGESWRSCMHPDDGEYNNGVLGYITGPDTLIAFTAKEEELNKPNLFGKKVWRQIMFISPECLDSNSYFLLAQKGYPKQDAALSRVFCDEAINRLDKKDKVVEFDQKQILTTSNSSPYGYVDALEVYNAIKLAFSLSSKKNDDEKLKINLTNCQGIFMCIHCGETGDPSSCDGLCFGCSGSCECESCADIGYEDDMYTVYTDRYNSISVCESCLDSYYVFSEYEGEYILSDSARYIESKGDFFWEDDCAYLDTKEEYVLEEDAVYIPRDGIRAGKDEAIEAYSGEMILMEDAVEVDGKIYHCFDAPDEEEE